VSSSLAPTRIRLSRSMRQGFKQQTVTSPTEAPMLLRRGRSTPLATAERPTLLRSLTEHLYLSVEWFVPVMASSAAAVLRMPAVATRS
jgi:hypothetical protein